MKRKEISTTENPARTDVDAVASEHSVANTEDLPDGFQMTELGPLPKEWRVVRLGEVAAILMGQSPPSESYNSQGIGLPFLQGKAEFGEVYPTPVKWCSRPLRISPPGAILLSVRAPVGDVNLAPFQCCIGRGLAAICANEKVDTVFLFHWLRLAKPKLEEHATGTTFQSINRNVLENFPIPLPPLPEQRAIAHVLRTVQRAKEATEGVIAALKELKKSLMQHLFTYGPVPVTERERVPLQETEIGPIPTHWRVVRLGELVEKRLLLIRGGFPQGQHNEVGNGVPHLRPFNITNDGNLDLSQIKYIAPPSEDDPHWLLPNDVIFNNTNSEELVGKTALFDRNGRFVLSNHMTLIRILEPKQVDAFWLSRQLHYFWYLGLYKSVCRRHVNQASISLERLKGISIPLPPLDEQREIARMLQAVDAKIAAEERRRAALEELFKTLLHALMSGRMRIPHIVGGERSCDSAPDADKLPKSED